MYLSVILIILSSLFFTIHDTIMKIFSVDGFLWYHYFSIGGPFGFLTLFMVMHFHGGLKKNLYIRSYRIPLLRGLLATTMPYFGFVSLKFVSLGVFTIMILVLPLLTVIFAYVLLKEKIYKSVVFSILIGFFGVILISKPGIESFNVYILFPLLLSVVSAINLVLVNKYKEIATPYGYAIYNLIFPYMFALIFFYKDPLFPSLFEISIIAFALINGIGGLVCITYAFHRSTLYSSKISPFIFSQLLFAIILGYIFFGEKLDFFEIIGAILVVFSGVLVLIKKTQKVDKLGSY